MNVAIPINEMQKEPGADKKRAMTYGLITEELSVFLAEHGFKDGKEHHINA